MAQRFTSHPSLQLLAGSSRGEKNAVVIHGIKSRYEKMQALADALVATEEYDGVWAFRSWSYWGHVSEVKVDPTDFFIPVKGGWRALVKMLGRSAAGHLGRMLATPSSAVQGAGQEVASALQAMQFPHVILVGHSLGGLVARCAVEAYEADQYVSSVVSLASPFRLWYRSHRPKDWDELPLEGLPYLQIWGSKDYVVGHKEWARLSSEDDQYPDIVKVVCKGANHTSIHTRAAEFGVADLIAAFDCAHSLRRKDSLLVDEDERGRPCVHRAEDFDGDPKHARAVARYAGEWLEYRRDV